MASCLRRLYDCKNSNIIPSQSHRYHLEAKAKMSHCARLTNGIVWIVSRPFVWTHALYDTVQLAKKKELSEPMLDAAYQKKPITPFPLPNMMLYIVHEGMSAFLKTARNDHSPNGLFVDKVNYEVFLPILNDIVNGCDRVDNEGGGQSELRKASSEDFLFTCLPTQALRYRKVILDTMGPQHQRAIRSSLEDLVTWVSDAIPANGYIENGDDFCGEFTAAVISRLFLNHPGPRSTYQEIHWAMTCIDKVSMQKRWGKLSTNAEADYQMAIKIISAAIRVAETDARAGSFVDRMRDEGFTDIQMRGMLFLVYLAGSGTTATAMKYLLWQLGRHPEYQEQIRDARGEFKNAFISQTISEALRLAPPVGVIGRFAARDLTFTITEKGKSIYSYVIPKGAGVLVAPLVAAKRQDERKSFDPEEVRNGDSLSWLPFSAGFHTCPGKSLALSELSIFVANIVRNYTIVSYPIQPDLKRHQFMSLSLPEKVSLQFTINR